MPATMAWLTHGSRYRCRSLTKFCRAGLHHQSISTPAASLLPARRHKVSGQTSEGPPGTSGPNSPAVHGSTHSSVQWQSGRRHLNSSQPSSNASNTRRQKGRRVMAACSTAEAYSGRLRDAKSCEFASLRRSATRISCSEFCTACCTGADISQKESVDDCMAHSAPELSPGDDWRSRTSSCAGLGPVCPIVQCSASESEADPRRMVQCTLSQSAPAHQTQPD